MLVILLACAGEDDSTASPTQPGPALVGGWQEAELAMDGAWYVFEAVGPAPVMVWCTQEEDGDRVWDQVETSVHFRPASGDDGIGEFRAEAQLDACRVWVAQ